MTIPVMTVHTLIEMISDRDILRKKADNITQSVCQPSLDGERP
jgi:hypothetical protein